MAKTEEEIAKLEAEHEATKKQLTELLAANKTQANEAEKAEKERKAKSPGKTELDPDVVKEVAELKQKMTALEKQLGGSVKTPAGGLSLNFFEAD